MKKLLALVLALVMSMSLVTISNAAFSDADKIDHKEAVEVMNALGVINGMPDGSFAPAGNVTRAEMAKMITIIMLGDIDAAAFKGTTTDLTDINGHWAEGYIKYCYSQGVIAGRGDGTFAPNANVTAVEAAKMLLVAIGYNADVQGYVGNDWAINIIRDAQMSKFFDKLSVTSTKVLTRDEAAQMIYNAVQAPIIEKRNSVDLATGNITVGYYPSTSTPAKTLLTETFGAVTKYGYITDVTYDSNKAKYTYTVSSSIAGTSTIATGDQMANFSATVDYTAFMGMKSKVVYKVVNNDIVVYGVSTDAEKVVSAKGADITIGSDKVTVDKKDYKAESTISVYAAGGYVGTLSSKNEAYLYDLYDVDDDGKIEIAVTAPYAFGKVTFLGTKSATIKTQDNTSTAYDLSKIAYYDGMAKDDYVLVTIAADTANDKVVVKKAAVETGKIEAVKSNTDVKIDGTWYKYTTAADTASFLTKGNVGDAVEFNANNGYIYAASKVNGAAVDNILYVVEATGYTTSEFNAGNLINTELGTYKGVDTRVMLPDGTTSVVKAMRVDVMKDATTDVAVKFKPIAGLYTYEVNSNGVYELKAVRQVAGTTPTNDDNAYYSVGVNKPDGTTFATASTTYYVKGSGNTASKLHNNLIDDDAVIYLVNTYGGETKVKTVSGATLKTMNTFGSTSKYLTKTVNGVPVVIMAYITDAAAGGLPTSTTDKGYGYITSSGYFTKNGTDGVVVFKVWNGTEEIELTDVSSSLNAGSVSGYVAGTFVSYDNTSTAGEVKNVTPITSEYAVTGYDGGYNIYLKDSDGTAYSALMKADNKTVVIYVDTAKGEGVEGGSISLAQEVATGMYVMNAIADGVSDGDGDADDELNVIFVDVANKLDGANYKITWNTSNPAAVNGVDVSGFTVTFTDDSVITSNTTPVAAGSTVKVAVNGSGTATDDVTITVTITKQDDTTIVKTISVANGAGFTSGNVTFTMPDMNIKSVAVTVA